MTTIFIASSKEDIQCAEQIRHGLEAKGYSVSQEAQSLSLDAFLASQTPETAILGSATIVLVWSRSALKSELLRQRLLFAQHLQKQVIPVTLDGADLPAGVVSPLVSQAACVDVIAQLLPVLPAPDSIDPLVRLYEQASHPYIAKRTEAIDAAAEMLQRGEHREAMLALLGYLATKDTMIGVRDKAQEVLDMEKKKKASPPHPIQSPDMFPVTCPNGHVTYVNVRRLCSQDVRVIYRTRQHNGKQEREFLVSCAMKDCGEEMSVYIDCEGYR